MLRSDPSSHSFVSFGFYTCGVKTGEKNLPRFLFLYATHRDQAVNIWTMMCSLIVLVQKAIVYLIVWITNLKPVISTSVFVPEFESFLGFPQQKLFRYLNSLHM